jgi:hypothetical protein
MKKVSYEAAIGVEMYLGIKVTTPKTNSYPSLTAKKATVKASQ